MRQLENVNFDIAFLGVTGFTMKGWVYNRAILMIVN